MPPGTALATVEAVRSDRSFLFTATDAHGTETEVVVVPCADGVRAWENRCPHEFQRLDTGRGVAMRDGQVICPRHGSMFDGCTGACDNGPAADTTLTPVEVALADGTVYLVDEGYTYEHDGGLDDDEGGPRSTSHLGF